MADIKEFLLNYYKQRHFNNMPPEVRAQFDVYRERRDFVGNMKNWNKELLNEDGSNKDVPELTEDADLEKLYNLFQDVLQDMAANKDDFKYETVSKDFLAAWFGGTKPLFDYSQATKDAEQDIAKVRAVLSDPRYKNQVSVFLKSYFSDDFTIDDLISGTDPKEKRYNSVPTFRNRMLDVIKYIQAYQDYGNEYWPQDAKINFSNPDTEQWFKSDLFDKTRFKNAYPKMLDALLTSKKLRDRFANYGSKKTISNQLAKAIDQTNYEDENSDDFVPAKVPDAKNLAQKVSDWKDETYENIFRKLQTSRGSRIYFTEFSREIIKAIDKANIKPTDGIDGLVSKHTEIESKLSAKSPTAKKHFAWFASTMEKVKAKMPKAYEKALRNGRSLRAVVSEVIRIAVRDAKVDEAKTALEILSVCKYGFTTSKAMNNLNEYFKENKEGIFSNKDLSWNKNEGVKFVTGALDKTVRFGIKATVQSIATLNHIIQKNRTKFNGRKGVKEKGKWSLGKVIDANTQKMQNEKSRGIQIANDTIDAAKIDIKKNNDLLSIMNGINPLTGARTHAVGTKNPNTKSGNDINASNIEELKKKRDDKGVILQDANDKYETANSAFNEEARTAWKAHSNFADNEKKLDTAIDGLNVQIADIKAQLEALPNTPEGVAAANALYPSLQQLEEEKKNKEAELKELRNAEIKYTTKGYSGLSQSEIDEDLKDKFEKAEKAKNDAQTDYDNLNDDITEYDEKNDENKELDTKVKDQQDIIDHWDRDHVDKFAELMSYWDTLESPSKSHSLRIATNKIRDKMTQDEERDIGGDKKVTMTKAQWRAWQRLQGYKYAA